jgi:hypothetical protein
MSSRKRKPWCRINDEIEILVPFHEKTETLVLYSVSYPLENGNPDATFIFRQQRLAGVSFHSHPRKPYRDKKN